MNQPHTDTTPPDLSSLRPLRTQPALALIHTFGNGFALALGIMLAGNNSWLSYIAGQLLLTLVFVHAFVLLHEAGHNTLFKQRTLNRLTGHYAGFVALIPFASWKPIHARHHRYTGWQDLDATTATLIPRPLTTFERVMINGAWRGYLPLFSILYRLQNYWHLPRIHAFLQNKQRLPGIVINAALLLIAYGILIYLTGFVTLLSLILPALLLSLAIEDILLLSQHTHIPQRNSQGKPVQAFKPMQQAQFSRSLRLPCWLSKIFIHFDVHELHHMYPHIPGYQLHKINYTPANEVNWLDWIIAAKRLDGVDFLFRNRNDTGSKV